MTQQRDILAKRRALYQGKTGPCSLISRSVQRSHLNQIMYNIWYTHTYIHMIYNTPTHKRSSFQRTCEGSKVPVYYNMRLTAAFLLAAAVCLIGQITVSNGANDAGASEVRQVITSFTCEYNCNILCVVYKRTKRYLTYGTYIHSCT